MSAKSVAVDHYRQQQRLSDAAAQVAGRAWSQVDPDSITGSWGRLSPAVTVAVSGAQQAAAQAADDYLDETLDAQNLSTAAAGRVTPAAFAGIASDGRPLQSLIEQPAIGTLTAIASGHDVPRSMAMGASSLDMIVRTQVADAGRGADQVALTARPSVDGYVRLLVPPSCSRCAILAGRWYRYSAGFQRHPRCKPGRLQAHTRQRGRIRRPTDQPARLLRKPQRARAEPGLHQRRGAGDPRRGRYQPGRQRAPRNDHCGRVIRPSAPRAGLDGQLHHPRVHHPPRFSPWPATPHAGTDYGRRWRRSRRGDSATEAPRLPALGRSFPGTGATPGQSTTADQPQPTSGGAMPPARRKVAMTNLPVHPFTRLTAIGLRRDGRPIWPAMGGDGTTPTPAEPAPPQPADPKPSPPPSAPASQHGGPPPGQQPAQGPPTPVQEGDSADQLGGAGKRALAAEREARKAAEAAAKQQAEQLAALQKQLDGLKPAADVFAQLRQAVLPPEEKTDTEKLTERVAAAEKATAEERMRRVQLEVIGDLKLGREWIEFLRGDTYDEMKAYAEKLIALMPKPAEPAPEPPAAGDPPQDKPKPKAPAPKPDPSQGARGATPSRSTSLAAAVSKAMTSGG